MVDKSSLFTTIRYFLLVAALCSQAFAYEPAFTVKDNDTWVMAGDSITAQRLHSSYIEAFFRTRYPQLRLHFRNSGISGDTASRVLARFDYDVAAWKPTIVSVELGMNDTMAGQSGQPTYISGMKKLTENIRALNAVPCLISSSPINDGSVMNGWASNHCQDIHPYTEALVKLGREMDVRVVDQYHPLLDFWGCNKLLVDAGALAARIRVIRPENKVPDLNTLQAFAQSWSGKPEGVPLEGNPIHPGPVGQYTMAATILVGLGVDCDVSAATLRPDGMVLESKHCKITNVHSEPGKLAFVRLDERSPWPIPSSAAGALKLMPQISDLSRYMLKIQGLASVSYRVTMNEKPVATVSGAELACGWNMSGIMEGVLAERSTRIMSLIDNLQTPLNNAWRSASKEKTPEKLTVAQKAIDDCEAKLQSACQPEPIRFVIELAK